MLKKLVSDNIDINPALCPPGLTHFVGVDNDQNSGVSKTPKTFRIVPSLDREV